MANNDSAAKNEKRIKLLLAAENMFFENGYHKTTVEDIAKAAGIGKSTFYEYFSSKEEILKSIVDFGSENFMQALLAELKNCNTVKEKISRVVYCCLLIPQVHRCSSLPLLMFNDVHEFAPYMKEKLFQPFYGIVSNIFIEGMNNGEVEEMPVDILMSVFIGCVFCNMHKNFVLHSKDGNDLFGENQCCFKSLPEFIEAVDSKECRETAEKVTDLLWRGIDGNRKTEL